MGDVAVASLYVAVVVAMEVGLEGDGFLACPALLPDLPHRLPEGEVVLVSE